MPQRNIEGQYPYAYQGQEKDAETGMEAFELRLWDARLGRWLTTDPAGQYASPYMGMGNNPISRVDPDGGEDWHYDSDGNLVTDEGDTAQGLSDFKGITLQEAQNIITSEGFLVNFNVGDGTGLMGSQTSFNRKHGTPYIIDVNINASEHNLSTNGLGRGWNGFKGRSRGPSSPIYGKFDISARISISNQGKHYLHIRAGAYTPNDPRNKNGSSLNIKLESDKSSKLVTYQYGLLLTPLPLLPEKYTYLGHRTILLPNNPNEISDLWVYAGMYTNGTGAIPAKSAGLKMDLMPLIIK